MFKLAVRAGSLAPYMSATAQTVPSSVRPLIPAVMDKAETIMTASPPSKLSSFSLSRSFPNGAITATTGIGTISQVRYAHTDVQIPDFSAYRRAAVKSSSVSAVPSYDSRKAFTYMIVGAGGVGGAYAAKTMVQQFVSSMSASADVLALAKIEIKLADVPEGKSVTFKWRGKPLFVRHRSAEEIEKERAVDPATLRDQEHDDDRVQKPEFLVVIGVCTHLGCVPIADAGDYGGYYCPCHGSHYDGSGRIRKGPAPLNLEVPEYSFMDEETLVVG